MITLGQSPLPDLLSIWKILTNRLTCRNITELPQFECFLPFGRSTQLDQPFLYSLLPELSGVCERASLRTVLQSGSLHSVLELTDSGLQVLLVVCLVDHLTHA